MSKCECVRVSKRDEAYVARGRETPGELLRVEVDCLAADRVDWSPAEVAGCVCRR